MPIPFDRDPLHINPRRRGVPVTQRTMASVHGSDITGQIAAHYSRKTPSGSVTSIASPVTAA
jgi:hypothetical protein